MPNITIPVSDDQAAALARGESITISTAPEARPIHNMLAVTGKSVTFIWDGAVIGGKIYAYRYQRLIDIFGNEATGNEVCVRPHREWERDGNCWSSSPLTKLIQVGA